MKPAVQRIRRFKRIGAKAIGITTYLNGVKWATFNLEGVAIAGGECVGAMPIGKATRQDFSRTMSIGMEPHHASCRAPRGIDSRQKLSGDN